MPKRSQTSVSALRVYQDCPRRYFYQKLSGLPKKTDYPRLCGVEVHSHVQQLYRPTTKERPFYFQTRQSMLGAWMNRWQRALDKHEQNGSLILPNADQAKEYSKVGAFCLSNYWQGNEGKQRPIEIEKRYEQYVGNNIWLVGIVDQIRTVTPEFIRAHRPDLMEGDRLSPDYDPVVIVDLKTDRLSYDARAFRENPALIEEVRLQYTLHENLQATAYTWLYYKTTGRKPIGFSWYHLRSGKTFFTYREERDFLVLFDVIEHVFANLEAQSFPKHIDRHCQGCDYLEPCREDRFFLISRPEGLPEDDTLVQVPSNVIKRNERQLRFKKFVAPRQKKELPQVSFPTGQTIVLGDLPWDDRN